ncbi:hypothetical protein [Nocardioides sp. GY 10113]|nr:hypothetical protein [Nocardioides sp. GY 10113]
MVLLFGDGSRARGDASGPRAASAGAAVIAVFGAWDVTLSVAAPIVSGT